MFVGGEPVTIGRKALEILSVLAEAEGALVTKDELMSAVWPGIIVEENAIQVHVAALRRAMGPDGAKLKTVRGLGYRVDAVRAADPGLAKSGKPSIAVLPFVNNADIEGQTHFVDGLTEEVVASLSRIRSIFVIASGTTLSLKNQGVTPLELADRLGVRYVLEGNVRTAGDRIRISCQLIDGASGATVWAERFDERLEDVFDLQDKVALGVAGALEYSVQHAELLRAMGRPTSDLGSYDLYQRAIAKLRTYRRDDVIEALALLERAIELDPNYAQANAIAACCHSLIERFGWTDDPDYHASQFRSRAETAVRAGADDAEALASVATAYWSRNNMAAAAPLAQRATLLNPGAAFPQLVRGQVEVSLGNLDRAEACLLRSMELDPISPNRNLQLGSLGAVRFAQKRFDEALTLILEWTQLASVPTSYGFLWSCAGHLGNTEIAHEAREKFEAASRFKPEQIVISTYNLPEHRALFARGIELAGG